MKKETATVSTQAKPTPTNPPSGPPLSDLTLAEIRNRLAKDGWPSVNELKALLANRDYWASRAAELESHWAIMARACGNWRDWPVKSGDDKTEADWQAAARAILERDSLTATLAESAAEVERLRASQLRLARTYDPNCDEFVEADEFEKMKVARECLEQIQKLCAYSGGDPEGCLSDVADRTLGMIGDLDNEVTEKNAEISRTHFRKGFLSC